MSARYALLAVLPVLLRLHLGVTVAGATVTLSLPWVIPAVLIGIAVVLSWLIWRSLCGFRSSPFPRPVSNWST